MLQQIIDGCGEAFGPYVTPELLDVLFRALLHQNRFVRETCYHILAALCVLCSHEQLLSFSDRVAERLQDGLNENWSQVHAHECQKCWSGGCKWYTSLQLSSSDAWHLLVSIARTAERPLMHRSSDMRDLLSSFAPSSGLLSELGGVAWTIFRAARRGCKVMRCMHRCGLLLAWRAGASCWLWERTRRGTMRSCCQACASTATMWRRESACTRRPPGARSWAMKAAHQLLDACRRLLMLSSASETDFFACQANLLTASRPLVLYSSQAWCIARHVHVEVCRVDVQWSIFSEIAIALDRS